MELITIAAIDQLAADARLVQLIQLRPGKQHRVLRRGYFERGEFQLEPHADLAGRSGGAEHTSGGMVYLVVVQFS